MDTAVKKAISLPRDLAEEAEQIARAEGKPLSGVIQHTLRAIRAQPLTQDFQEIPGYWSRKAKEKGILTEGDLKRYLKGVRVVFDTNVFVSALAFPGGQAEGVETGPTVIRRRTSSAAVAQSPMQRLKVRLKTES